jgi:hypothetical protein
MTHNEARRIQVCPSETRELTKYQLFAPCHLLQQATPHLCPIMITEEKFDFSYTNNNNATLYLQATAVSVTCGLSKWAISE